MSKLRNFSEFLSEKKSPYKKATLLKYKRKWEAGEEIPFGVETSLKAQGMIPRADGEKRVSDEYKKAIRESFEETMMGSDVTVSFVSKEGKTVEVKEIEGTGMVGEAITFAYIFHDGIISSREEAKTYLKPSDYRELCEYLADVTDNKFHSALKFVK